MISSGAASVRFFQNLFNRVMTDSVNEAEFDCSIGQQPQTPASVPLGRS